MKKAFKRILSVLLVAVMIIGSAPMSGFAELEWPKWLNFDFLKIKASAEEFDYGDYTYTLDSENNATITGFKKSYSGSLNIPSVIGDSNYKVVAIGNSAFYGCENLTSVTIPDSVTSIESHAFYYCEQLENIDLRCVERLGNDIFNGCSLLKSIEIPRTVNERIWVANYDGPFAGSFIEKATIEKGIAGIPEYLFSNCTTLKEVSIPEKDSNEAYTIGKYAFNNTGLTEINLPNGITKIEEYAFLGCESLINVTIPDSVISIDNMAFGGCLSLRSVDLPKSIYVINSSTFKDCKKLSRINLENITEIGDSAFENCSSLKNVEFNYLKSIGEKAFACTSLEEITISKSITDIYESAFYGCAVKKVIFNSNECCFEHGWGGDRWDFEPAFEGCSQLTTIVFGENVTNIPAYICKNVSSLKNIVFNGQIETIGNGAFWGCSSLSSFDLPKSINVINSSTFKNCENLSRINLENITEIGDSAFENCSSLKNVEFNYLKSIGEKAFACTSLEEITISKSITDIYESAFYGCAVKKVIFNSNECCFEHGWGGDRWDFEPAFEGCSQLTTIVFGENVTNIPAYICKNVSSLKNIVFNGQIETIGNGAFWGCSSLSSFDLPESISEIGSSAFKNCQSLTEVKFLGISSLSSIEKDTFDSPRPNISLVIPSENSEIALRLIDCEIPFTAKNKIINTASQYLDRNTSKYYPTSSDISLTNTLNLVVSYNFKQTVDVREVLIKLPSSTDLISVKVDGTPYECSMDNNGYIKIYGVLNNSCGRIIVSVKVADACSLISYAKIDYYVNYKKHSDVIGIVNVGDNLLTLNVPHETSSNSIKISGITLPETNVDIYVDGTKKQSVRSKKSGAYATSLVLENVSNDKSYCIEARTDKAKVAKTVKYNKDSVKVISAKMYYRGQEYDLVEQEGKLPVISWAANTDFVFEIKLDKYTGVESVYVVSSKGGEEKLIKAYYDADRDVFVAKGFKNYVPGTISITVNDITTINQIKAEISAIKNEKMEADYSNVEIKTKTNTIDKNTKYGEYEAIIGDKKTKDELIDFSYRREKVNSVPLEVVNNKNCINTSENGDNKYTILTMSEDRKTVECTTYNEVKVLDSNDSGTYILKYYIKEYIKEDILGGELDDTISIYEKLESIISIPKDTINSFEKWYNLRKEAKSAILNNQDLSEKEKQEALSNLKIGDGCYAVYICTELISNLAVCLVTVFDEFSDVPVLGNIYDAFIGYIIDKMSNAKGDMQEMLEELFRIFSGDDVTASYKYAIDPSGFVYEAVPSNRLGGVTATIYYSPNSDGSDAIKWDASEYDQNNPIKTYEDGTYFWDVPEGYWQVKFEKEGYETTYSEWLPVPPPQLDVNVGIVSKAAPTVELVNIYQDEAEIKFSQYMDIDSITSSNVTFTCSGKTVNGSLKAVDAEKSYDGSVEYATTFSFIPDVKFDGTVTVNVSNVKNYAGKSIAATYKSNRSVVYKLQSVEAPETVNIAYDSVGTITLTAKPALAAKGKKVYFSLNDSYIAALGSSDATFDENGVAKVKVTTLLPGMAELTYNIEGTTCEGKIVINVDFNSNVPVEGISINKDKLELKVGESNTISVAITPEDASNKNIEWSSSNSKVATVNENGVVSAISEGTAEIKVITEDGKFEAVCVVTVKPASVPPVVIESISIKSLPNKISYYVGDRIDLSGLTLEAKYSDGTTKIIENGFECSPKQLTSVGKKTVTVTYEGKKATFDVSVLEKATPKPGVKSVSIDDISLNYKKSTTLKPTIKADDGAKYKVEYSTSNAKVATVDQNGKVTATRRGSGTATITCTVTDSNGNVVKDTCKVSVSLTWWQWIITIVLFGWIWY